VTGLALSTLKQSTHSADLPVRVLSLIHKGDATAKGSTFGATSAMTVRWTVHDLLLWKAVGQGEGLAEYEPDLADYMVGYVDWLRTNRIQGNKMTVELVSMTPGVFEWPAGGGNQYYGVDAVLTVNEVI